MERTTPMLMIYYAQTLVNELFQTNLTGEHTIGKQGVKVDYGGSLATVNRNEPFTRSMTSYRVVGGTLPNDYFQYNFNNNGPEGPRVFFADFTEKRYTWQSNVQVPFQLLKLNQSFKIGYQGSYRKADYGTDLFSIETTTQNATVVAGMMVFRIMMFTILQSLLTVIFFCVQRYQAIVT